MLIRPSSPCVYCTAPSSTSRQHRCTSKENQRTTPPFTSPFSTPSSAQCPSVTPVTATANAHTALVSPALWDCQTPRRCFSLLQSTAHGACVHGELHTQCAVATRMTFVQQPQCVKALSDCWLAVTMPTGVGNTAGALFIHLSFPSSLTHVCMGESPP